MPSGQLVYTVGYPVLLALFIAVRAYVRSKKQDRAEAMSLRCRLRQSR